MSQPNQTMNSYRQESYWARIITSLRYQDFRLIWLGSITEHAGQFMQIAAILWIANEMTRSPLMLTIVGACKFIPLLFLPIIGGVAADRMDRRTLLITSLFGAALISLCLALLVMTGAMALWHLIAFNLIGGTLTSFNHPARQTIIPNLVKKEHLLNAVSLDNLSVQASRLIGMAIAGYLIVSIGVGSIFVLRALGCLLSIAWLLIARVPPTPPATREQTPWRNLIEGFHYLRNNSTILGLMLLYLIPMLAQSTFTNFMPIFANDILRIGAVGYGYIQGAPGLGAIIGLSVLTMLTYYKGKPKLLSGAGIILGIVLIGFSASRWIFLSLPLILITGGMIIVINSVNTTLIQNAIPDQVRGRVMSWREVSRALGPTSSIFFGAIAQYTGVQVSLGLLGGLCLLASLLLIFYLPRLRSAE